MGEGGAFFSSGDLVADRRYQYARALEARGAIQEAIELLEQTIAASPRFACAWFALGQLRGKLGDRSGAIAAFREAWQSDREDRLGASLHLARLGALDIEGMPEAYVRTLFDQYAARFDTALVEGLSYCGPRLLREAITRACAEQGYPLHFPSMLDLGCGTGLAGAEFRPFVEEMVGVDLSEGMIAAARRKGLYDRLETSELLRFLITAAEGGQQYSLILAADVFAYLADLHPVMAATMRVLTAGGYFAFTVETHQGDGVILGDKLRYAHGAVHVRSALANAGFALLELAELSTRTEAGVPVPGLVVVARRV